MILQTVFLLFGIGAWAPGLETIRAPETILLSPLPTEWSASLALDAKSVLVMDVDSMGIVYQQSKDTPLPMASLTKMMTALIILENHSLSENVLIPPLSEYVEGSSMRLKPGDTLTVSDLLHGLMINSGNDAATVLAMYHSGTVFSFVKEMNTKADELGLRHTHFQNPHGLDAPHHYSSAHDLAILSKMLLSYPALRKIVTIPKESIPSSLGSGYELVNTNALLDSPFPVYGIKTGTTDNAGECLVLLTRVSGKEHIVVILGSSQRYLDAKILLWYIMGKPETSL